ncbi:MAG: cytochrome b/b6 domain-containing protein [Eggerthellaceae bacterium]|nr:cytochrome b/b6 domain-containing protein [Eggerthellaceae bacterium]
MAHLAHYREAHPTVFVVTHWVNMICIFWLIFTGFLIHFPFIPWIMSLARGSHVLIGFVLVVNCVFRIVASFFVESAPAGGTRQTVKDYKTWLPQKDNRHQGWQWIKYYLFLRKTHPLSAKLGVPQKITYLCIPILILCMLWSGLCIWGPTMNVPAFYWTTYALGGLMAMRIIHYFGMYVFILFIFIHVYLANIEGFSPTWLMLLHREHGGLVYDPDVHDVVAEDENPQLADKGKSLPIFGSAALPGI